jgi:periplasmic divalent cation tolerance protein
MSGEELGMAIVAAPGASARRIARTIVERRLAACAQVTARITSVYWWKEKVQEAPERLIFLKTERSRIPGIRDLLESIHPYEVPELIFLPVTAGSEAYLAWLSGVMGD